MQKDKTSAPISVPAIRERKHSRDNLVPPITALTAYDYTFAKIIDEAGVDLILVGDSLGTVVQGYESTIPVTLDEMIYHCRCVSRAAKRALIVGDLPFMSYQVSPEKALEAAGRLIKEGFVSAVKLEGGLPFVSTIQKLVQCDIPIIGHIGLTPQSYHRMGGHKVQGREHDKENSLAGLPAAGSYERILQDAIAIEEAGAFAVVIEGVPGVLAAEITARLSIPTIGIGAGIDCDGQILVSHDMLGMQQFNPRFVKRYAELGTIMNAAISEFINEVSASTFPGPQHSFGMKAKSVNDANKKFHLV